MSADGTSVDVHERSVALFGALADPLTRAGARDDARAELIGLHAPLVEHLARRFQHRGETYEDLVQVGMVGLIKAIDRFEPERGLEFSTYATPTVVGELKRHLRDKGWAIRIPRRLQELRASIATESAQLTQSLGRSPTVSELAGALDVTSEEILEGLESGNAWATVSLESSDTDEGPSLADSIGSEDDDLDLVELRESLRPLLDRLDDREKRILVLRYFRNLTQAEIAAEIGISQMHVSRLLTRTLDDLRQGLDPEE